MTKKLCKDCKHHKFDFCQLIGYFLTFGRFDKYEHSKCMRLKGVSYNQNLVSGKITKLESSKCCIVERLPYFEVDGVYVNNIDICGIDAKYFEENIPSAKSNIIGFVLLVALVVSLWLLVWKFVGIMLK